MSIILKSVNQSSSSFATPQNIYCIMQIVCGGKVSQLHDLLVIRGKTFAIVQQFKIPYNKKEKIHWKTFELEANLLKTTKVFHHEQFALYGIIITKRINWKTQLENLK